MKVEHYKYKGGSVDLLPDPERGILWTAYDENNKIISRHFEVSKSTAKRLCEEAISNHVNKPYASRTQSTSVNEELMKKRVVRYNQLAKLPRKELEYRFQQTSKVDLNASSIPKSDLITHILDEEMPLPRQHKPPVKKIKVDVYQAMYGKQSPDFKEPTAMWPCPEACKLTGEARIKHIEHCPECHRLEREMDIKVHPRKTSEQTKRIMSMKRALDTNDKKAQKEHTQRILGEEWNKDV